VVVLGTFASVLEITAALRSTALVRHDTIITEFEDDKEEYIAVSVMDSKGSSSYATARPAPNGREAQLSAQD
jgi:hypothetical protein